jgi:hypothetical protein
VNGPGGVRWFWFVVENAARRLVTRLFPVGEYEAALFQRYALDPVLLRRGTAAELIGRAVDCDTRFIASSALPASVIGALPRCHVISRRGIGTVKNVVNPRVVPRVPLAGRNAGLLDT